MAFAVLLTFTSGELARLGFGDPIEPPKLPEPEGLLRILDAWELRRDDIWDLNLNTILTGTYRILASPSPGDRLIPALLARGLTAAQDDVEVVQPYIDHPDLQVRLAAMRCLGQSSVPSSEPLLTAKLESPEPRIQRAAVDALGSFADEALIPSLEATASRRPELQAPVRRAIRKIRALSAADEGAGVNAWVDSPEYEDLLPIAGLVRDQLIGIVLDRRRGEIARIRAARLLAVRGGPLGAKATGPLAADREESLELRIQVVEGIGRSLITSAYPLLLRLIEEDAPELKRAAIRALGWMQAPQAAPFLAAHYNMEGNAFLPEIRLALWQIFRASGPDLLEQALRANRGPGIAAIQIIEDAALSSAYKGPVRLQLAGPPEARREAVLLLAFAGDADDAAPLQRLALEDADTAIRELAALAARKVTQTPGEP